MWVLGESWIEVRRMTRKGPRGIVNFFEGLDDGNIEEKGRGIENTEVRLASFFFVGRTEDMAQTLNAPVMVLWMSWREPCLGQMASNGINRWMTSAGAAGINGWLK